MAIQKGFPDIQSALYKHIDAVNSGEKEGYTGMSYEDGMREVLDIWEAYWDDDHERVNEILSDFD